MSTTDLFGNPLVPGPEIHLSTWQKRQATLLYHFASADYLKGLKKLVDDFVKGVDITLDLAQRQGRDSLIATPQWGVRDTAANFSTYGFSALRDFQRSLVRQQAQIAKAYYHATGYNQCARLLDEMGMGWTTPDEAAQFEAGMEVIGRYAGGIDSTMRHAWKDGSFFNVWQRYAKQFPRLPKFRVRTEVVGESGKLPSRSGVYVPQNDPYGSLQFAWTGNNDGRLFDCATFNDLGLEAVSLLGRERLWGTDDPRLLELVKQARYRAAFLANKPRMIDEKRYLSDPFGVCGFISLEGITRKPCKWYFVERIEGEYEAGEEGEEGKEGGEIEAHEATPIRPTEQRRCPAGQPCPRAGYWFTPAKIDSRRRFREGELMPDTGSRWGMTIWQWDDDDPA